jgi:hypothetical protein
MMIDAISFHLGGGDYTSQDEWNAGLDKFVELEDMLVYNRDGVFTSKYIICGCCARGRGTRGMMRWRALSAK